MSTSVSTGCGCDAIRRFLKRGAKRLSLPASGGKRTGFIKTWGFLDYHGLSDAQRGWYLNFSASLMKKREYYLNLKI
jgi:hypothetical protein